MFNAHNISPHSIPSRPNLKDVDVFTIPSKVAGFKLPNAGVTVFLFAQEGSAADYWTIPVYHN